MQVQPDNFIRSFFVHSSICGLRQQT